MTMCKNYDFEFVTNTYTGFVKTCSVPCCTWNCILTDIPGGLDITEVSGCYML